MSNLLNKVKDTLSGGSNPHTTTDDDTHSGIHSNTQTTAGAHRTDAANKADPRVDSDRDGSHNLGPHNLGAGTMGTTTGTHNTHDTHGAYGGSTDAGPHASNMGNKVDPRIDSDRDGRGAGFGSSHTAGSTNVGPHSNVANKLDPRVDSDMDNRGHGTHTGPTGTDDTHNTDSIGHTGLGDVYPIGTNKTTDHGPHSSNIANKLDPGVDSDRDHRGAGATGAYGTHGTHSTTTGAHTSAAANKLDPRVDTDRDHRATGTTGAFGSSHTAGSGTTHLGNTGTAGSGTHSGSTGTHHNAPVQLNAGHTPAGGLVTGTHGTHTGTGTRGVTGTHGQSTDAGPHASNAADKVDPSDRDHRAKPTASHTGPAPNTAGPHKSDLLNKLDPRVDSDLDGSKTYGTDKTHADATGTHTTTHH